MKCYAHACWFVSVLMRCCPGCMTIIDASSVALYLHAGSSGILDMESALPVATSAVVQPKQTPKVGITIDKHIIPNMIARETPYSSTVAVHKIYFHSATGHHPFPSAHRVA